LVLQAALDAQVASFDLDRLFGDLVGRERHPEEFLEDANQGDDHRRAAAQAGARRRVRTEEEVEPALATHVANDRLDEVQFAIEEEVVVDVVAGDDVVIERLNGQDVVIAWGQRGVGIAVDGGDKDEAAVALGVGRDVGAATAKANPERGLGPIVHRRCPR
jgi:hypothetical protein